MEFKELIRNIVEREYVRGGMKLTTLLNISGTIVIIIGFISGFLSSSFLGFVFAVIGSVEV